MKQHLKTFIISVLRRATFKWKSRTAAYNAAKIQTGAFKTGRAKYSWQCAKCEQLFKSKEICMDHVDPVVPIAGWQSGEDFDLVEYVERMFPDKEGWQCLCGPCHDKKTEEEDKKRNARKRLTRNKEDDILS